ncbi:amino acid ABC transporter permease [Microlunatus speluncae]|uniref:amino acid ABC transporter permease n=1 Tax=Microlunatus speluncae TaxID=2594267 RepID=UPI00126679F5|nr:amino acid ABC transporter permease [Microlunatus speluncae]
MSGAPTVLFDVPGPKARVRHRIIGAVALVLLVLAVVMVALGLANPENNQFAPEKWNPFQLRSTWTAYILPGLLNTLLAAVTAVVLSIIAGVLLGLGRLAPNRVVRFLCGVFVEFFRAVPVLMMMLFSFYLGLYVFQFTGPGGLFFGVVSGLFFYNASVIAELVRSGVGSLPRGQREAGLAIGMTEGQTLFSIQLPQAITAMLPSIVSQLVVILKDTALGTWITYTDLLQQASNLGSAYANTIPSLMVVAVMYIVINYALTWVARWLERRLKASGRGPRRRPEAGVAGPADPAPAEPVTAGTAEK